MIYWSERLVRLPIVFRVWMIGEPSTRENNIASLMGESSMRICNSLLNNCYLVEIFNDTSGISLILPSSLPSDVSVITQVDCHQNQFPPLLYVSINSTIFLKKPYSQKSQHFFSTVLQYSSCNDYGKFNTHVGSKVPCCKALRVNLRNFSSSP